jgi:hypothetical protein
MTKSLDDRFIRNSEVGEDQGNLSRHDARSRFGPPHDLERRVLRCVELSHAASESKTNRWRCLGPHAWIDDDDTLVASEANLKGTGTPFRRQWANVRLPLGNRNGPPHGCCKRTIYLTDPIAETVRLIVSFSNDVRNLVDLRPGHLDRRNGVGEGHAEARGVPMRRRNSTEIAHGSAERCSVEASVRGEEPTFCGENLILGVREEFIVSPTDPQSSIQDQSFPRLGTP